MRVTFTTICGDLWGQWKARFFILISNFFRAGWIGSLNGMTATGGGGATG
jgi:hypothetical protein